jgi:hypothetical protein
MPTVQEILKQTGWSDEDIAAVPQEKLAGFTQILSTSEQMQQQAELAKRATNDMLANEINPKLDAWGNEEARLKAEIAFYKAQAESGKAAGFIPADAPGYTPQQPERNAQGQFVSGQNPVPGSPVYITPAQAVKLQNESMWLMAEHMRLHGQPVPDDLETLMREADAQHMPFRQYVGQKYQFDAKRKEIETKTAADREATLTKGIEERVRREMAEKYGNNPMVRPAADSKFSQLQKAVESKQRPDPLSMSREQRHANTSRNIQKEVAENSVQ